MKFASASSVITHTKDAVDRNDITMSCAHYEPLVRIRITFLSDMVLRENIVRTGY